MQEGSKRRKGIRFEYVHRAVTVSCCCRMTMRPRPLPPPAIQPLIVDLPHQVHPLLTAYSLDSCPPIQFAKVAAASKNPSNAASIIGSMFSNSIRWAGHCGQSGVPIDNFLHLHEWHVFEDERNVEHEGSHRTQQANTTVKVLRHFFGNKIQQTSFKLRANQMTGAVAAASWSKRIWDLRYTCAIVTHVVWKVYNQTLPIPSS
jgi:hypothetical protein